jgi:hypothetical protein
MPEVSQQAYLGDVKLENHFFYLNNKNVSINPYNRSIPSENLVFYLNPLTYSSGSSTWLSTLGNTPITGSIQTAVGMPVKTSNGIEFNQYQTLNLEPRDNLSYYSSEYTLFIVGRFSGSADLKHGRLLVGGGAQNPFPIDRFALGTLGTGPHYAETPDGFLISPTGSYDTTFRLYTLAASGSFAGSGNANKIYYENGQFYYSSSFHYSFSPWGFYGLGINTGSYTSGTAGGAENNTCEIGEIFLYNKKLNDTQINDIYTVVKTAYNI